MVDGKPGPLNAITDVDGILVGQASDARINTGVTVILPETPCPCAVDVRGGGPGTRESDALDPVALTGRIDALVLSGGSVYGLAAADGVASALGACGQGFSLMPKAGVPVSPIVPAAILYDLANGGEKGWGETPPYHALGRKALQQSGKSIVQGRAGAGTGAQAGAYRGGIGTASFITDDGWQIGALVAVNSFGSPFMVDAATGKKVPWAWALEQGNEFGGVKPQGDFSIAPFPTDTKIGSAARENTTIAAIAVNATLSLADTKRLAIMAQDGLSRAIRPIHAPTDGDVVFALATGQKTAQTPSPLLLTQLGSLAADCLSRAIARAIFEANK